MKNSYIARKTLRKSFHFLTKLLTTSALLAVSVNVISSVAPSHALDDITYEYDAVGRLMCAIYTGTANKTLKYTYDDAGNRTKYEVITGTASCITGGGSTSGGSTTSGGSSTSGGGSNSPPNAVNDTHMGSYDVFEAVLVSVLANDSDPDGDALTITSASCISGGCFVSIVGSQLSVFGTSAGDKSVSYTISDGNGGTDTATALVGTFADGGFNF